VATEAYAVVLYERPIVRIHVGTLLYRVPWKKGALSTSVRACCACG